MTTLNNSNWITAADMSPDGNEIIMRAGATTTGLMYIRPAGGSVADALATTPISIPLLSEAQGEAIGFDSLGRGYYTTSEGAGAPIHYYDRLPPPAGTMYWDNDGVAAGSHVSNGAGMGGGGTWNTTSNKWYNASSDVPWVNGNDAVFWGSAGTVTLSVAQSVNSLAFKSSGYTIAGSTLTMSGATVTVDSGVTASIASVVAGSAGFVKNGAGTLQLTTANTYSGGTIVNAGVLGIVSSSLGATPTSPGINVTINNGSTLRFDVNGLTLATNRQILLGPGGGVIDTRTFTDTIAGVITGSSLTKIGSGTLALTNTNTYTGATTVAAGRLKLTQSLTASSSLIVQVAAAVELLANGNRLIRTDSLSMAATAKLDLNDNDLLINSGNFAAVQALVIGGYRSSPDAGATGIISTTSQNNGGITVLALFDNALVGASDWPPGSGQTIGANAVVGKYTYFGDLNLDGQVTGDDYATIDANLNTTPHPGVAWLSGDANLDGVVTGDDYGVIDANLGNGVGNPLSVQGSGAGVPEPTMVWGVMAGLLIARRRRANKL